MQLVHMRHDVPPFVPFWCAVFRFLIHSDCTNESVFAGLGALLLLQLTVRMLTSAAWSPESSVAVAPLLRHMGICLLLLPTA